MVFPRKAHLLFQLAIAVAACAQQQASWRISGKVVDAHSGQALARCAVAISPTRDRGTSVSMMTAEDGKFHFDGLALGKYQLTATCRGYLTQSYQEHDNFSTAIAVGPNLRSEDLVFDLMPQAILFGLVTDEAGEGVRRAQIQLFQDRDRDGVRHTQHVKTLVTDDRGMYEIANVAPGNYYLAVSAQPWYAHGQGGMITAVGPGLPEPEPDSTLDVAYPVTYYPNATDSDEATPIPLRGGERVEINLSLNPQHAMRLHLAVDQAEGRGYAMSIQQSIFGQMQPVSIGQQRVVNGVMDIEGVLPGHYDFTVTEFGPNDRKPTETHFAADVATGETELREQAAIEEVTVSGNVTSPEGKLPAAGVSLAGLRPRRNYHARLDEAGAFSISVPPGDYEVIGNIPRMYVASVSSLNAEVKGRMLTVKAGAAPRLQIVAGSGFASIDGVAEAGGQKASGVMVLLAPVDAKDNHILFRRDQSDSDGTFSLYGIIPGRYHLLAIDGGWDLEWMDPNVLSAFLKKSILVQIHANDKLQQTVVVQQR